VGDHDQEGFSARFDWGIDGLQSLAPVVDVVVIVDVLRFTTCVDVAVARGATILPYRWNDGSARAYADEHHAELAGWREDPATPWSLSPTDLANIPPRTRLVLPSPNGSALAFGAVAAGAATVIAGCIRNATAVATAARGRGSVAVIAAGERWNGHQGGLRPAVEDLLGAGAVLAAVGGTPSPEAEAAIAAFEHASGDLHGWLLRSGSGRELVARGWDDDVDMAAALDASTSVPALDGAAFVSL
jgi:2-phosphosulfolactate phosphatase